MREELLKGLKEFGNQLETKLKLVRFEIDYDKDLPFIRDGVYILPKENGKAEVFIYPQLLGVRVVDITPLFEKEMEIIEGKSVKSLKEIEDDVEPEGEQVPSASEYETPPRVSRKVDKADNDEDDLSEFDEIFEE